MSVTTIEVSSLPQAQFEQFKQYINTHYTGNIAELADTPIRIVGAHPTCIVFAGIVIVDDIKQVLDIIGGGSDE